MLNEKRNRLHFDGWVLEPFIDYSLSEEFDCGDDDLNEFFRKDLEPHEKELLTKTYMLIPEGATGTKPVALISFCNDSIRLKDIEESIELSDVKKISLSTCGKNCPHRSSGGILRQGNRQPSAQYDKNSLPERKSNRVQNPNRRCLQ